MTKITDDLLEMTAEMADLFCGAGGTSTGAIEAAKKLGIDLTLVAVNHWKLAIETHFQNHPKVKHINSNLERVDPRDAVPSGHLDFLWASPECTYYSNALGGKPVNNQSRATPKWVLKWLSNLDVTEFGLENVPEFRGWGPLHRTCNCGTGVHVPAKDHQKKCHFQKPIKNRKGEYFKLFIKRLKALGYTVDYRVLCAADYGVPTTRQRLFIIGSKKFKTITWPEPTHHEKGGDLRGKKKMWKSAKDHVIDPTIKGESIFNREARGLKPLSPNTLRRIYAGLEKFGGLKFMLSNQSGAQPRLLDEPVPTLTANGSIRVFEPFITTLDQGGGIRSVDRPLHTLTSAEATAYVQPYLISLRGTSDRALESTAVSIDSPAPTITGGGGHLGYVQPFIISHYGEAEGQNARVLSVNNPFPTVVGSRQHALIEPFIVSNMGDAESHVRKASDPVSTVTGNAKIGYVEPFIVSNEQTGGNGKKVRRASEPVYTITGNPSIGYVEPFMVEYRSNGNCHSVTEPTPTITNNDCLGLAMPVIKMEDGQTFLLDIHYRMFKKHEYAAAQGFPKNYKFKGGSKAVMKQIGNAVPPGFAYHITRHRLALLKGINNVSLSA